MGFPLCLHLGPPEVLHGESIVVVEGVLRKRREYYANN